MATTFDQGNDQFENAKWEAEKLFREREIAVKEREQEWREAELELKRNEYARSQWSNPLVVAILAAAIAAAGTTAVALLNGIYARQVEAQRAEEARILEVIKTGDPDKAAVNIEFLLEAGLIGDQDTRSKLMAFIRHRQVGAGPSLPIIYLYPKKTEAEIANEKKAEATSESLFKEMQDTAKKLDDMDKKTNKSSEPHSQSK